MAANVVLLGKAKGPAVSKTVRIPVSGCAGEKPTEAGTVTWTVGATWLGIAQTVSADFSFIDLVVTGTPPAAWGVYSTSFTLKFPTGEECIVGDSLTQTVEFTVQKQNMKFVRL